VARRPIKGGREPPRNPTDPYASEAPSLARISRTPGALPSCTGDVLRPGLEDSGFISALRGRQGQTRCEPRHKKFVLRPGRHLLRLWRILELLGRNRDVQGRTGSLVGHLGTCHRHHCQLTVRCTSYGPAAQGYERHDHSPVRILPTISFDGWCQSSTCPRGGHPADYQGSSSAARHARRTC
jgi:hypothetical protein